MLDWEGLLKFSLQYSDGTKKSEFKPMSPEDRAFLEAALNEFCNSEVKRLQEILNKLSEENAILNNNQDLLEEMQELLDSLDKGSLLYKIGGHIPLLKIIFYSKYPEDRILALQVLSSANQNDAYVQNESINSGALELAELILKETDMRVRENMFSTISSIIRGENLEAKRIFIRIGGLQTLCTLLAEEPSQRLRNKVNTLLRDLIYYDSSLDKTYNDLSSFSNTAGLKIDGTKADLTFDVNAAQAAQNYLPENAKYKGSIADFMSKNNDVKQQYDSWLEKELENEKQ